jgi:hypothetical protein
MHRRTSEANGLPVVCDHWLIFRPVSKLAAEATKATTPCNILRVQRDVTKAGWNYGSADLQQEPQMTRLDARLDIHALRGPTPS